MTNNEQGLPFPEVINGVLTFNSIADYEAIVDAGEDMSLDYSEEEGEPQEIIEEGIEEQELMDYIEQIEFENYGVIHGEDNDLEEPFLAAILNVDKIIQMGNWLIKVDVVREKVWVIPADAEQAYENLRAETGEGLQVYSTGDDVLDILQYGPDYASRGCSGVGSLNVINETSFFPGSPIRFSGRVRFFRAGIYFKLSAKAEYTKQYNGALYLTLEVRGPEAWRKRRPCRPRHVGTASAGVKKQGRHFSQQWVFYSRTRSLNGYYLFARAGLYLTPPQDGGRGAFTTWVGRNISSPY